MGVKIRLRGKSNYFYLDINHHGQRYFEALGFSLPKDKDGQKEAWKLAETIRRKRELQLAAQRYQLLDPIASKMSLIDYATEVAEKYDKKAHLPKSLKYLRPFAENILLCDVDERLIDRYRDYLLSQKTLGPATAAHYLDAMKALLSRAERERIIDRNPAKGMKPIRVPEAKKPWLTVDEIQRLADTPVSGGELPDQCKRGFLLSCFTGLRLGDIKNLAWGDIVSEPEPSIVKRQNKTGAIATIPLCPTAWELINDNRLHKLDDLIFPRLTSTKSVNVHQSLISLRKRAGIDRPFGWHAGRHSFAMMTLKASGDIYAVSRLLGHSNVQITTAYLRLTDPRKKEIIESLPSINLINTSKIIEYPIAEKESNG